jgi:DNA modification methylase
MQKDDRITSAGTADDSDIHPIVTTSDSIEANLMLCAVPSVDLFGNEIIKKELLRDKFIEPPFSVLNSTKGPWQKRKNKRKRLGIKSEVGRALNLTNLNGFNDNNSYETRLNYTGTSIFDPVLCELIYHWFCCKKGLILDPFAGGSVRGIVANYLDYKYTGIELRKEQVDSNREQALNILAINNQPQWYIGDSEQIVSELLPKYDLIFSCPPYMDLEVYSNLPSDLSQMNDAEFISKYEAIIHKSCSKLKEKCFAVFVVGEVRDKKTGFYKDFVSVTKNAFYKAGLKLYNDAVFLESGLNTAAMRADNYMKNKKLVKVHQNVLVFRKV